MGFAQTRSGQHHTAERYARVRICVYSKSSQSPNGLLGGRLAAAELIGHAGSVELLTTKEAAALLKIKESTLQDWARIGRIRAVKLGRPNRAPS